MRDRSEAYGRCPHCGAKVVLRERRINGNDYCENGHVYPSSPLHPSDQGWDEWRALVERVDRSNHRPWWDERAGWCVRRVRPNDGEDGARRWTEILGKGRWSMHRAYEFAARQLDIVGNSHHPGEA